LSWKSLLKNIQHVILSEAKDLSTLSLGTVGFFGPAALNS